MARITGALTKEDVVLWQRILNRRGWATRAGRKRWGGSRWNVVQRYIFLDELHQFPAPEPLSFNVSMIGPVIGTFGTPEQRTHFAAAHRESRRLVVPGLSEPGAGSDLAALTTTLCVTGITYVVNGNPRCGKAWPSR